MMDPVISRLSNIGAKGGVLAMLAAFAAFAVSRDPIALLVFPILISAVQLLCLIEGPWTSAMMQRLPVRVSVGALARAVRRRSDRLCAENAASVATRPGRKRFRRGPC